MTLHEVARRLGVETRTEHCGFKGCINDEKAACRHPRPSKDIAHECLAKLPMRTCGYEIEFIGDKVSPYWLATRWDKGEDSVIATGTFEEAVLALATRYLERAP